jgi:hypothetical protein
MSEITELAAKYARQVANTEDLQRTVRIAVDNLKREQQELDATAQKLKDMIGRNKPSLLIPIGFNRHVLVYSTNGSFGVYASIDIIEESK